MAASSWKLTVTFLGSQASARELVIRAENWPSALREGRHQLGEEGGVPAGASCAVSSSGIVTVLAPAERRRYVLEPLETQLPSSPSSPAPSASTPAPAPVSQPSPVSAPSHAFSPTLPAPPANASDSLPSRAVKSTLAYSADRAEALRKEFELAHARSLSAEREHAAKQLEARAPSSLEARSASEPSSAPAFSSPIGPATPRAPEPLPAREAEASRSIEPRRSSLPAPAAALRSASLPSTELPKARPSGSVYGLRGDGLALLAARDLDPSASSPLTYRERAYLLGGNADRVRLEVLLQAELACLRRELAGRPRGQFVRLGVFREPFEGAPVRAPLATLEWKDWRGRAVFQLSDEAPTESPSAFEAPVDARQERASRELDTAANAEASFAPAFERPRSTSAVREVSLPAPDPFAPVAPPPAQPRDSDPFGPPIAAPVRTSSAPPLVAARTSSLPPPAQAAARTGSSLPPPPGAALAAARELHASEPEREGRNSEPDTRLAAAFESMPDLHLLPTPVAGLEFTLELLSQLVPCDAISGCLYDVDTDEFRFVALSGLGALERKASAIRANAGLFGAAARARTDALLVSDVTAEPRFVPAVDARPGIAGRNFAYVPVRHHGQLLGMLQLINRDLPHGFSQSDVSVLTYVAAQLGEFLANIRAFYE